MDWIIAVGFVVISLIVSSIIIFILNQAKKVAEKTKTTVDDEIIESLKKPIRVILILFGIFLGIYYLNPEFNIHGVSLTTIFTIIAILVGAYVIARIAGVVFRIYAKQASIRSKGAMDEAMFKFARRFLAAIIYAIAIMIILDRLGIEIGPLLTGLGIAGLAVALALQDTLSNLFSGIYIVADKTIKIGDYIDLDGKYKGRVQDIKWRSTKIKTSTNNIVIIPNLKLAQNILTNYSIPEEEMILVIPVSVSYNSDLEKVERVTLDVAKKVLKGKKEGFENFEPILRYEQLADSCITFSLIIKVNLKEEAFIDQHSIKHEFIKELIKRYRKEKIEIPFPQRDVHVKK